MSLPKPEAAQARGSPTAAARAATLRMIRANSLGLTRMSAPVRMSTYVT